METSTSRPRLPQLSGQPLVTDGGLETDLIFNHGWDLPHFAAFPMVDSADGREALLAYYSEYADVARAAGVGLMLEAPTWRANPDWGAQLGYSREDLRRANLDALALLAAFADSLRDDIDPIVVSGLVGPRGDGYMPGAAVDPGEAADYHSLQMGAFAEAGADMVTAMTIIDTGEAIGIVRAARGAGLPVAISFTVEVDGRLPDGRTVADAVEAVDTEAPPDYYLINCAHPTHIAPAAADGGGWRGRVAGLRYNASVLSHAELDEATELNAGDPHGLAREHQDLRRAFPNLAIVGGCCGTDARHVAALWGVVGPPS